MSTIELTEVEDGWLVLGAYLESEARQAVFEDIVDRLGEAKAEEFAEAILELADADARPGYWEIAETYTLQDHGQPSELHTDARRIHYPETDCFGFHLVIEEDED